MKRNHIRLSGLALLAGCLSCVAAIAASRVDALPDAAWSESAWIRAADAKIAGDAEKQHQQSAAGTSWFASDV